MIKVKCYCRAGKWSGTPHETFIVKNSKKIKFWKALSKWSAYIRVEEYEK